MLRISCLPVPLWFAWALNKTWSSKLICDHFDLCSSSLPTSALGGRSFLSPERCEYSLLLGDISVIWNSCNERPFISQAKCSPALPPDLFGVLLLRHNTPLLLNCVNPPGTEQRFGIYLWRKPGFHRRYCIWEAWKTTSFEFSWSIKKPQSNNL